jgi:voltage-gated potassium channel
MDLPEGRFMEKKDLKKLEGHVILAGFGATGRAIAEKLKAAGKTVVVVDRDPDVADKASQLGYDVVTGSISTDSVLDQVNTSDARALIVNVRDPDRMLSATLIARMLNPNLLIYTVTGAGNRWLAHAGASELIFADELVANEVITRLQLGQPR